MLYPTKNGRYFVRKDNLTAKQIEKLAKLGLVTTAAFICTTIPEWMVELVREILSLA